ncbi:hypothetical protein VP01_1975g2 [Puccinia sorghi]|uniref:Uncharacterized protein n=1 Tax=Puccinia sorghi TaxID=27349 RepID=A0A0L6VBX2_9BASI|nr:hypothetical protein VP01_1975g2 [Puccinia sorghi]
MALLWNFIDKLDLGNKSELPQYISAYLPCLNFPTCFKFSNFRSCNLIKSWTSNFSDKDSKNVEDTLYSQKGKCKAQGNANSNGQFNTSKRCRTCYHNPKQDRKHSKENCWYLHPKIASKEL